MTFEIGQITSIAASAYVRQTPANAPAAKAASTEAVRVDAMPSSPPPEVSHAIGVAAKQADGLAAKDRELKFTVDPATGHVQVEVHDTRGNLLFVAPPSHALKVAGGGNIDELA